MATLLARPTIGGYAYTNDFLSHPTWHGEVIANGDLANDNQSYDVLQASCDSISGRWKQIIRPFYAFDTSAITISNEVTAVTLTLIGYEKTDEMSDGAWALVACDATLDSYSAVIAADYQKAGAIQLSDTIVYASFNAAGNNVLTFNATGLTYINRIGYTVFCIRDYAHDLADELDPNNHDPAWIDSAHYRMSWLGSGQGTVEYQPLLTVTYGPVAPISSPGDGAFFARKVARFGF